MLLEPAFADVEAWFAEIDRKAPTGFMARARHQPPTPTRRIFE